MGNIGLPNKKQQFGKIETKCFGKLIGGGG
jgi:hypothetical protein